MKVTIFGSGYVGLVTGTCFADAGNDVVCVDIDAERVAQLRSGEVPIYEPGLDEMLSFNQEEGRLRFTTDAAEGVHHGLFQFIAVGTPPDEDGSADLQHVLAVARSIGQHMNDYRVVVNKSTVPVGTADRVRAALGEELAARGEQLEYDVVSNPEFLKEGAAIDDFVKPDRIIVGTDNPRTGELMKALYAPFNRNHDRLLTMDVRAAELTKYASNAMLATKISFMNELSSLAERLGADIEQVRVGMGSDPRIGYHFIYPGCGYGGSCFPKDVKALTHTAHEYDYRPELLEAVENVNDRQKRLLVRRLHAHFGEDLAGRTFGLWGLAFKPNTDDMREAPSRVVMEALWEAGARVQAYDPEAMDEAERVYGNRRDLELCDNLYDAVEDADALIVCTEWQVFRSPDFERIRDALRQPVVFDGRNVYPPSMMEALGFTYYGVGRGESIRRPL
ncbi:MULTISPECIES: UDP-glucose dehydrogenase family protein [unclassified Halorhodospira]|uniref:UDP-glucose dehydrogenase family protein n=1 Tax=unclassified Halorhodospira TaxID=2626748 RepID=UPI001EE7BF80|nr:MULTISPECIES: UDP-glucose/GDP-mannose dehydrogenase family protein [unclassified Halorhodospira]MCG5541035.1 UDP-glucose/GDP-mannose dehydrogenase family protein [Halorhodospira sp. M39old]MCG5546114.1 UDP-glucose/GDP-mannose dehydrogenase family protein [Halorhodospira sp. M38]